MIAKLTGLVDSVHEGFIILDVNGVGYRVFCSTKTIAKLPARGEIAALFIETQVREDHIHLFGFSDATEQQAFTLLTVVQGVGAKVALGILSALSAAELQMAVMTGDAKAFTRANGVGPKLATRIVTELKGKLGSLGSQEQLSVSGGAVLNGTPTESQALAEAVSALTNLGYSRTEAGIAAGTAFRQNPEAKTGELIRLSLKELGKGAF